MSSDPLADARRELELWQQRCAELYDEAPTAYVTLDEQGVTRDINLPGAALLGVDRRYAIGLPFRVFVAAADRRKLTAHLARFHAEGHAVSELCINTRRAGGVGVELRSRRSVEGPELCFTAVINLSAQRRLEAERHRLEDAELAAREAGNAKDQFIASLSHELRAPLAPVLVALSSLKSGHLPEAERVRLMEMIRRNVLLEARLIDDLLDVTRMGSGKLRIDRQLVDVHQIVREVLEMFGEEIHGRGLMLATDLQAPRHHVQGDPVRLRQVFGNLIKNAIRFTPPEGIISVGSWNRDAAVVVEVRDDGEGIEPEALERIFNRFEQASRVNRATGGLGLGLAISKGIVELHDGVITAHSAGLGHGARFLVELGSVAGPAVEAVQGEAPQEGRRPPQRSARAHHERILLVEDEPDLAQTLALLLQAEGFEVLYAPTAGAALDVDLDKISVVITDLGLPDLNGRDLLTRLRARREVKAIALSGYGTEADVRASREAGFLRHLTKPVELEDLLGAIDSALDSPPPRPRTASRH